jgi:hypothetical protein
MGESPAGCRQCGAVTAEGRMITRDQFLALNVDQVMGFCVICGTPLFPVHQRLDTKCCGGTCRMRLSRRRRYQQRLHEPSPRDREPSPLDENQGAPKDGQP